MTSSITAGFWPQHGQVLISEKTLNESLQFLQDILQKANKVLAEEQVQVVFLDHIPKDPPITGGIDSQRNLLLGIRQGKTDEPIDIFDLKALDEKSFKPLDILVKQLIYKVREHLAAKQLANRGILISSSGSKFDCRLWEGSFNWTIKKGYLCLGDHRLISLGSSNTPIKAEFLRSYSISHIVRIGNEAHFFDEFDFLRTQGARTMFVDLKQSQRISADTMRPELQKEAEAHDGEYWILQRGPRTPQLDQQLKEFLLKYPSLAQHYYFL